VQNMATLVLLASPGAAASSPGWSEPGGQSGERVDVGVDGPLERAYHHRAVAAGKVRRVHKLVQGSPKVTLFWYGMRPSGRGVRMGRMIGAEGAGQVSAARCHAAPAHFP
jgi:hypothetical protein